MKLALSCLPLLLAFPAAAQQSPPEFVPLELFKTMPGLEVTLWAKSPLLKNPTNLDTDAAGRIWVAEGANYRSHQNRVPEGDRIVILEDKDGDGTAETSSVFVQEPFLKAPLGVAVFDNVIVVSMTPDMIVYTDVNRDLKFDPAVDKREVLLTGFNGRIHDHSLHSVVGGPDGNWYWSAGNCGAVFTDKSSRTFRVGSSYDPYYGKKGSDFDWKLSDIAGQKSDDGHVWIGGFAARMNPDGKNVEIIGHNFRNSYEQCVNSLGEVFQNDNDDPPACRVSYVMEGGNAGFSSFDGKRGWAADKRPGQDVPTAEWRQEDPGTMPAGDVYGGGSPTGNLFYENGALGEKFAGMLLTCEPGRNTIFGYHPKPEGAGYKLERFDFLTTNAEGQFAGSDFKGGGGSMNNDVKTLFRPSDVVVGADGALYVCDWFDGRVGGHSDLDEKTLGAIYRIAPKGFKSSAPQFDLKTVDGAIAALKSPASNVRFTGLQALKAQGSKALPALVEMAKAEKNQWLKARALWALSQIGKEGCEALEKMISPEMPDQFRMMAFRALRRANHNSWEWTLKCSSDPSPIVRREAAIALRDVPFEQAKSALVEIAKGYDGEDRTYLEALGLACEGKEAAAFCAICPNLGNEEDSTTWPPTLARIAWRLHPPQLAQAFAKRAKSTTVSSAMRKEALVALAYISTKDAADAMVDVAKSAEPGMTKALAEWWLINRKSNEWKDFGLDAALKETGIYDPAKVVVVPIQTQPKQAATFSVDEVMKLTGDSKKGLVSVQACFACHKVGEQGVDFAPNLSGWAQRQTRDVLIRSIVDPSFDIAHGYEGKRVILKDGMIVDGMALFEGDPTLMQSMGGLVQRIPEDRIQSRKVLDRSLMMSADELGLKPQDVADIAEYLRELK